jgi:hypothetical protein
MHHAFDYLSPSVWASIGAIATKSDDVWKDLALHKTRLDSYKAEVNRSREPSQAQVRGFLRPSRGFQDGTHPSIQRLGWKAQQR